MAMIASAFRWPACASSLRDAAKLAAALVGRPGEHLREQGERYENDGAAKSCVSQPGVEQVANADVERQPGKVEQRDGA
jgi:hypothetical protein